MEVYDAAGNELTSITLNPRASQTWTAAQLGLPAYDPEEGKPGGGGVVVAAWWANPADLINAGVIRCEIDQTSGSRGTPENTTDQIVGIATEPAAIAIDGFRAGRDYNWWYAGNTLYIDWSPDGAEPAAGQGTYSVTLYYCDDIPLPRIAGAEKHTVGTVGPRTSANTEMVDGYSAIPLADVLLASVGGAFLDAPSRWVIPIVQTNNGWNTAIVITNVSGANNSVNATFYAAGGQGFAGPSVALLSGETLGPGESIVVDLREDAGFPDEEVGSVWIDATRAVVAMAFRNKPSTEMMLTTVAQPRTDNPVVSPTLKYGPLVFRDYNGWNTGINIANLSSATNQVSVTYYNYAGNVVAAETRTIPSRAMEYVYTPATGSFGIGENQITAVRIQGTAPLAAAIDEVKYLGGQGEGHAMSYAAGRSLQGGFEIDLRDTQLGRVYYLSMLALPLVQKGNPQTGTGDTSGINLFNSDANSSVEAWVQFLDSAGVPVAPTVAATDAEDPLTIQIPAGSGATLYTLNYSQMPAGFTGAAVVGVVGDGALLGVSNNVNYEVAGDGSAVFNLAVTPQATPRFAVDFDVDWGESPNPVNDENGDPVSHTVTVTVRDLFGDPAPNVRALLRVTSGPNAGLEVSGTTGANGQAALSYTNDDGELGTDQLEVWVDLDRDGVVDADETETGTKEWVTGLYRVVSVTPEEATNLLGTQHTVTVTVTDGSDANNPVPGAAVTCEVRTGDGPNAGATFTYSDASQQTDENGQIKCTYTGENAGEDTITATADGRGTGTATKTWVAPEVSASGPTSVDQGDEFEIEATATNRTGFDISQALFRIIVKPPEPEACGAGDSWTDVFNITAVDGEDPQGINDTFACVDGRWEGSWGPSSGFPMPNGYTADTTFTVQSHASAPAGIYTVTLRLVDLSETPERVLAETSFEIHVTDPSED
ncbi:Ig-like domain-containing protein [Sphaerobacter thermophilus]|uniref:Big-1 domain-containing protein n=1 Tax=Sphaerobacter thermophilus (strain ATCC 49802 / DSM 20745 / KCCM 41009 / NCIMB 13125 / S 6022) TaxID=479434 RepID=D1C576_SPHTD|nr:Ig-like domain-containing protein [Sphaerobacter thermophilus]ACZ39393.1 hypothetical protein Sthe_1962 [Sphaerobacter thermophilus DSM 20745]